MRLINYLYYLIYLPLPLHTLTIAYYYKSDWWKKKQQQSPENSGTGGVFKLFRLMNHLEKELYSGIKRIICSLTYNSVQKTSKAKETENNFHDSHSFI